MNDSQLLFLKKYVLRRKTDLKNPDSVLRKCCELAFSDMLDGGRYYLYKKGDKDTKLRDRIIDGFISELNKGFVFSNPLIDLISSYFGPDEKIYKDKKAKTGNYVTRYGLSQKFVNMCFKYFYVFEDELKDKYSFDFSKCDCPIDSVILDKLEKLGLTNKGPWSKLSKGDYGCIQKYIQSTIDNDPKYNQLKPVIGKLSYDFLNW